jgi:hypothetical protein
MGRGEARLIGADTLTADITLTAGGVIGADIIRFRQAACGATVMRLALFLICLQIGYLGGAALRFSLHRRWRMERPFPGCGSRHRTLVSRISRFSEAN